MNPSVPANGTVLLQPQDCLLPPNTLEMRECLFSDPACMGAITSAFGNQILVALPHKAQPLNNGKDWSFAHSGASGY